MSNFLILPNDEQVKIVKAFLEALEIPFVEDEGNEELPDHVKKGIQRGIDDFKAGRYISIDEFKKKFNLT